MQLDVFLKYVRELENLKYKYYKTLTPPLKVYRVCPIKFSSGEDGLSYERWCWDFNNWNGHIHDREKFLNDLRDLNNLVEITEQESKQIRFN